MIGQIILQDGPFVWNEPLQGLILSAYFWGYMVSLLPGGRMSELLSAKWVMNGSVLLNVVASILSPIAANIHYSLFIVMRFIQGLGGVSSSHLVNMGISQGDIKRYPHLTVFIIISVHRA